MFYFVVPAGYPSVRPLPTIHRTQRSNKTDAAQKRFTQQLEALQRGLDMVHLYWDHPEHIANMSVLTYNCSLLEPSARGR